MAGSLSNPVRDNGFRQKLVQLPCPQIALGGITLAIATGFWLAARWMERSTQNLDFAVVSYAGWPLAIGAAVAGYFATKNSPRMLRDFLAVVCGAATVVALAAFLALSNSFICTVPGAHPPRYLISDKFRDDPERKIDTGAPPQELLQNWNYDPNEIYDGASLALIQTSLQVTWMVLVIGTMSSLGLWTAIVRKAAPSVVTLPGGRESPAREETVRPVASKAPAAALAGAVAASLLIGGGMIVWRARSPGVPNQPRREQVAARSDAESTVSAGNAWTTDKDRNAKLAKQFNAGHKWAVVIGVNQYLDPGWVPLRYCVNDAKLIAKQLSERCGYDPERILLMTDDQEKLYQRPLLVNFEEQVRGWLSQCKAGDTVLVFFAGHGILDRGNGYLVPQDCRYANKALTAWPTDELRKLLHTCAATQKLLILDCCHAGVSERGDNNPVGPSGQELGQSFARAEGLITLASCRVSESSNEWEAQHHGMFTYVLAKGLAGAADFDHNGIVDSDEIYRYTVDQVPLLVQREQNAKPQTPVRLIGEDVVGVFAISQVAPTKDPSSDTTGGKP